MSTSHLVSNRKPNTVHDSLRFARRKWLCFPAVGLAILSSLAHADPSWQIFQLTSGSDQDSQPDVSGTTYVWQRGAGNGGQIMMWSEGDPAPVAISDTDEVYRARVSNGRVVWYTDAIGGDYEIKLWENGIVTTLTSNSTSDTLPDIGGDGIAWLSQGDDALIYFNGVEQILLTAGLPNYDEYPSVHDDALVWYSGDSDNEIFYWRAGVQQQLTDNSYNDVLPETDGVTIVWQGHPPSGADDEEIFSWTQETGIRQLTDNTVWDSSPDVSGDIIVFIRDDGSDFEIFLYYLGLELQLTDNDFDDFEPQIDGNRIVWEGEDNGGDHIFYAVLEGFDGTLSGACCFDLECQTLSEEVCLEQGGTYRGDLIPCDEDACGFEPASGWSTYQHDVQRTGRTTAIVPDLPNRLWSLLVGENPAGKSPVIAPDGTIYIGATPDLVAVTPDGSIKWITPAAYPEAPPVIRRDGYLFVPEEGKYAKIEPENGGGGCAVPFACEGASALDSDGHSYIAGPGSTSGQVSRSDPNCGVLWTYTGIDDVTSAVALDGAGGVLVSGDFEYVKLNAADGTEAWSKTLTSTPGAPAVAPDGTSYITFQGRRLRAYNSDGSIAWTRTFADINFTAGLPSPAIGADGIIYVAGTYGVDGLALAAVNPDGTEKWMHVESPVTNLVTVSPVIDGAGKVFFSSDDQVVVLDGVSGTELWRLDVGDSDYIDGPPAIAEDGTLYVTTGTGYLIAYGAGCPEDVDLVPDYDFEAIVHVGDQVEGFTISALEAYEVTDDGRMIFKAKVAESPASAVFVQRADGGFDVFARDTVIDGQIIDTPGLPRMNAEGNVYLPADLANTGDGIFVNDQLYLQTEPSPEAIGPVVLEEFSTDFMDLDLTGDVLLTGKIVSTDPHSGLRVRRGNEEAEILLSIGALVDALGQFNFVKDPEHRRQSSETGSYVLADDESGVVVNGSVILRSGDVVDGYFLTSFNHPQINAVEQVHYWASTSLGLDGVFTPTERRIGTGDTIDGYELASIERYDVNDSNSMAITAELADGTWGVFTENDAVAVEAVTVIDGAIVESIDPSALDQNNSGQIAFTAVVDGLEGLYVATATGKSDPAYDFRKVMAVGDVYDGTTIGDIREFDLSDAGTAVAFIDNVQFVAAYVLETSEGITVYNNGDPLGDYVLDFTGADERTPLVDDDGNVYLYSALTGVGPTLFRNSEPLVQRDVPGATAPVKLAAWYNDVKILDFTDDDKVLLYGRGPEDDLDGLLVVDAIAGTVTQLFADGASFPGWTIETIDAGPFDERHVDTNSKTFVVHGEGRNAVMLDADVHVRDGQVVAGYTLSDFSAPQVDGGTPVFIAEYEGGNGLFDSGSRIVGTGDEIGGHTIAYVTAHSTVSGSAACVAELSDGRLGVFRGTQVVAIEGDTLIGDELVVSINAGAVRQNHEGDVAFLATTTNLEESVFVASGPDGSLSYRRAAGLGDTLGGLTFDLALGQPHCRRQDAAGRIFQSVSTSAGVQTILLDGRPFLQPAGAGATATHQIHELDPGLFDVGSQGHVAIAGRLAADDPYAVLVADPDRDTVEAAIEVGDPMGGLGYVEVIDFDLNDQRHINDYGDVAFVAHSLSTGAETVQSRFETAYVKGGENVGGFTVSGFTDPQITDSNLIGFLADYTHAELGTGNGVFRVAGGRLVGSGDPLEGYLVESWEADGLEERVVNAAGTLAAVVNDGALGAVVTQYGVQVQEGDDIGGYVLEDLLRAMITPDGSIYFHAVYDGGDGVFTPSARVLGTGDPLAEGTVETIYAASVNSTGVLTTILRFAESGRRAIYSGAAPVCTERVTVLEGAVVESVTTTAVRSNDAGLVAFVARTAGSADSLYVAAPDGSGGFTYRRVVSVGDEAGGTIVHQIDDFRISDTGLMSFSGLRGGGELSRAFAESAPGVFTSWNEGAIVGGATLGFIQTPPRIDSDGDLYLVAETPELGNTVFLNGLPFAQEDTSLLLAPVIVEGLNGLSYVDVVDGSRISLFADIEGDGHYGVVLADTTSNTVTPLLTAGDYLGAAYVDRVDAYYLHEDGTVAYIATLEESPNERVLVSEGKLVAREGMTIIDGDVINAIDPIAVRTNESRQVAFLAQTGSDPQSLFVASPSGSSFSYRRVAGIGDVIDGFVVESFDDFRLTADGLTRFLSLGSGLAEFIETAPGQFDLFKTGDELGGRLVSSIDDLRLDEGGMAYFRSGSTVEDFTLFREMSAGEFSLLIDGDYYGGFSLDFSGTTIPALRLSDDDEEILLTEVAPYGPVIFADRVPLAQMPYAPSPSGDLTIAGFSRTDYVDPNGAGQFLVLGTRQAPEQPGLLRVDPNTDSVTTLIQQGQVIDGFEADQINPAEIRGFGDDGSAVFAASNGSDDAIMTPSSIIARSGDVADGYTIADLDLPRRIADGTVFFRADGMVFKHSPEGSISFVHGDSESVAGQPILNIDHFAVNDAGSMVFQSDLLGARSGVFVDQSVVAIAEVTYIDGVLVTGVGLGTTNRVSINNNGEVAFVAHLDNGTVGLYLANPQAYFDGDGDEDVDLIDYSGFQDCLTGPNGYISAECAIFDANGDCRCDMVDAGLLQVYFTGER